MEITVGMFAAALVAIAVYYAVLAIVNHKRASDD